MADQLTARPPASRLGWAARWLKALTPRRHRASSLGQLSASVQPKASSAQVREMTRQLIAEDRYVFVLLKEAMDDIAELDAEHAWAAVGKHMALIPSGVVPVVHGNGGVAPVEVPAFYFDRYAVTNRQFQRFVDGGGYDTLEIWPQEVWPSLMKFSDQTHRPGPRDWSNGKFPSGKGDHPVVGVCWYEASAYASWVGKRLPHAAEWQKAGGWPEHLSGGACNRYPWGDVFDPKKANIGAQGAGKTVPVNQYSQGATPNGIFQMTGNVWEWLTDPLDAIPCHPGESFFAWRPMRRIVGGSYDTYFSAEATCQFVTGQPALDRRENIGFRCAVSVGRLRPRGG